MRIVLDKSILKTMYYAAVLLYLFVIIFKYICDKNYYEYTIELIILITTLTLHAAALLKLVKINKQKQ